MYILHWLHAMSCDLVMLIVFTPLSCRLASSQIINAAATLNSTHLPLYSCPLQTIVFTFKPNPRYLCRIHGCVCQIHALSHTALLILWHGVLHPPKYRGTYISLDLVLVFEYVLRYPLCRIRITPLVASSGSARVGDTRANSE
ncbi:uncharacterized protein BJ212DRAFT_180231 [Suillus subaureus]|uniref:Secreted protein n=1 Tax=Suillus subaureus TaxID=48587 RepID=A0A9P7ECB6_9AGAM|nr:uncharacterized protein BJ212DRAFT_180231 [Suillus subaureus]KAG1816867.1 hypothetical protein BJ212DRAFT_180231 [Suillus subaureus]